MKNNCKQISVVLTRESWEYFMRTFNDRIEDANEDDA